jgi:hypothetical protein
MTMLCNRYLSSKARARGRDSSCLTASLRSATLRITGIAMLRQCSKGAHLNAQNQDRQEDYSEDVRYSHLHQDSRWPERRLLWKRAIT